MAKRPLEIDKGYNRDDAAKYVSETWHTYQTQRLEQLNRWQEVRNYVFATDTTTTTNKSLPWKNSTTLPKLCQIRDNLHSNYLSALFPNDDWLRWEAYTQDSAKKKTVQAIEAYIGNKIRQSDFRTQVSLLLYDYIDYGNSFSKIEYERSYREDDRTGERVKDYVGPRIQRISPYDIVFNPLAANFKDSFKIIRYMKTIGELMSMAQSSPENQYLTTALEKRNLLLKHMNFSGTDIDFKQESMRVDGYGNFEDYMKSGYVEMLEFWGDVYDADTNTLSTGRKITVIDRMWVIDDCPFPTWFGYAPIFHAGWRRRADNLWAMGPLENLVGMQYRIDHLENAKADAMDLAIHPPLVVQGEVEEFQWGPGEEIHIDENGNVTELARNVQWVIQAENSIDRLEQRMELYAGAPREAMGVRTAGEKTKYEVQTLENAAGRIFQEKINMFEIELLERSLNAMLESAKRNMDAPDVVKVIDNDLGVSSFMNISKEDITAIGVLRPIGSRHFSAQSQLVQNLTGLSNTPIWNDIKPHLSTKNLATLVEDVFGLSKFSLFRPNTNVFEQQETQDLINQAGEDLAVQQGITPP